MNETYFPADYFDYVIIDEFHHAVTDQYRRIVDYFQPQFLLGLTATPERMDGKNIVLRVQSDSAVPDSMQKTWQKNSAREELLPQQYIVVKMENMLRSVTKPSAN